MKEGKKKGRKITHLSDILGDYQQKNTKFRPMFGESTYVNERIVIKGSGE